MNSHSSFVITGIYDYTRNSLSRARDVNGDQTDDFIIGALRASNKSRKEVVFIVFEQKAFLENEYL